MSSASKRNRSLIRQEAAKYKQVKRIKKELIEDIIQHYKEEYEDDWKLSDAEAKEMLRGGCYFCGETNPMKESVCAKGGVNDHNYTKDNTVVLCFECKLVTRSLLFHEAEEHLEKIARHLQLVAM